MLKKDSFSQEFTSSITAFRKTTQTIMREVEYIHRAEMHDTSLRIKDMERVQQKILTATRDQKRILMSLKEGQNLTLVIQEQQKIMQAMQQIQMRLPAVIPSLKASGNYMTGQLR